MKYEVEQNYTYTCFTLDFIMFKQMILYSLVKT